MLTEKDYCDYDTCVALKELGYVGSRQECECFGAYFNFGNDIFTDSLDNTEVGTNEYLRVPLYEAQQWLREEKKLIVLVGFDFCPITSEIVYNWVIVVNGNTAKKSSYTYDYFEEALSEGIKEAVKILKDGLDSKR